MANSATIPLEMALALCGDGRDEDVEARMVEVLGK